MATVVTLPAANAVCALDMGSNSFKFVIAEVRDGRYVELIEPVIDRLSVGDDLSKSIQQTGEPVISDSKLKEVGAAISKYMTICKQHQGGDVIYGVATAAFRQAKNQAQLLAVTKAAGAEVEIIDGIREAELSYKATVFDQPDHAVADFGSRSTEFVTMDAAGKFSASELDTGYRTAFQKHFANATSFAAAAASYRADLTGKISQSDLAILKGKKPVLQVMEAIKVVTLIYPISEKEADGKVLSRAEIAGKVGQLSSLSSQDFAKLIGTKEIDQSLPRLVFLDLLLELTGYNQAQFTTRELYAGLIWDRQKR